MITCSFYPKCTLHCNGCAVAPPTFTFRNSNEIQPSECYQNFCNTFHILIQNSTPNSQIFPPPSHCNIPLPPPPILPTSLHKSLPYLQQDNGVQPFKLQDSFFPVSPNSTEYSAFHKYPSFFLSLFFRLSRC
jgi:hypothetical protein